MKRWGTISVIGAALVASVFFLAASRSYSPGPVMNGHASFETQCANCHQPWHRVSELACEDCHRPERSNSGSAQLPLPDNNQHASLKVSEEIVKSPSHRIRAFKNKLGCLSCHHDHRGRMVSISTLATDAGTNCEFCHQHPSIRGVTNHSVTPQGATVPMRRKYISRRAFFVFRSPSGETAAFKHASHFDDLRKRLTGMGEITTLPCEFCHQLRSSAEAPIEFNFVWLSGIKANAHGCGVSGCHDGHSDTKLTAAQLIRTKVDESTIKRNFTVLKAEFRHSLGHLKHRCVECHAGMEHSRAIGSSSDPSMSVKNCFSCHAHSPPSASLQTAAVSSHISLIDSTANAMSDPAEKRVTECSDCHRFHAAYDRRTSLVRMDFTAAALRVHTASFAGFTPTAFTIGIIPATIRQKRVSASGFTVIPILGSVALVLAGFCIFGLVRWESKKAAELADDEAPPPLELVYHKDSYETNIERLYVVGEAAGIASINLAIRSGRQAIEAIAAGVKLAVPKTDANFYDVAIVGCGSAGLGAASAAKAKGLSYLVLERLTPATSIRNYPRAKPIQASIIEIPEYGTLFVMEKDIVKEALIKEWEKAIDAQGLEIQENAEVVGIRRDGDLFELEDASHRRFKSRYVIVAIGARSSPRHLNVPGETSDRVLNNLVEPSEFQNKRILVVGGGNSGTEVAQMLAEPSLRNVVSYSFRESVLSKASAENVGKIARLQTQKMLQLYPATQVKEIRPGKVILASTAKTAGSAADMATTELDNDYVFAMLGTMTPPFIKQLGIRMIKRGRPS